MKSPQAPRSKILPNVLAGLTSGLVNVVYSISFAALIFSGSLSAYFPQGVGTALLGAAIAGIVVACRSRFPFTIAGPEANSAIILALAARAIADALPSPAQESARYPTVWAAIALSSIGTGLFLYLLGRWRLGQIARYVPYPVIGGFLAGTGCLITRSSFKVMTGIPLGLAELPNLLRPDVAGQWIAGVAVAAALFFVLDRWKHFLVLPGVLLGGTVLANIARAALDQAAPGHDLSAWFLQPFSHEGVWQAWKVETFSQIDWTVLGHHSGSLLAMMVIVMLSILLNSTGLEVATARNVDLNGELRANGIANLVNGACGGMVGYLSVNRCVLNQQAGATSPLAGILAGAVCAGALLADPSFLARVPRPLMGGLLFYIGANLLVRWVVRARSQLARFDYLLVVLILTIIVSVGFLAGVGSGILIACLLFIVSYGRRSSIKYTLSGRTFQSNVVRSEPQQRWLQEQGDAISILVLHGFVFFGTAHSLIEVIRRRQSDGKLVRLAYAVFDFRLVTGLDSSAALSFLKLEQLARQSGLQMVFTGLSPAIAEQLRQGGVGSASPGGFRSFPDLDRGVEWCEDRLLAAQQLAEPPASPLTAQLQDLLQDVRMAALLPEYLRPIELGPGQHLFHQGDAADGLYFLESGRVSVMTALPDGSAVRWRTYTGGAILGEMGFYSKAPRSASVVAEQSSRLHFLSDDAYARMETENPLLAACFNKGVVHLVAERLRRSEEGIKLLLQ